VLGGAFLGPATLLGPASAEAAPGDSRLVLFAERLRRDPVYLSPSLARVLPGDDVAALRREVADMPYPTFVVVAPRIDDEPGIESFTTLPVLLHDRLGRDGVYVVSDEDGIGLDVEAFGVRPKGDARRASSVASDAVPTRDGPVARVRAALTYLRTAAPAARSVSAEDDAREARPWWFFGGTALLGLVVPLAISGATPAAVARRAARRQERRRRAEATGTRPTGVLPRRSEVRRVAQEAAAGLARAIAEAPAPPDDALRSYDAASHLLSQRGATAIDLVGAAALADAGRARVDGAQAWRPCLFDPRHGEGSHPTRWRLGGDDALIPACAVCARAIAAGEAPVVLLDAGRPYFERDTVWARTGFGAIDDRVADVVLAGGRSSR
jgi:hypothetical protein